jgi:hypothetical protein
MSCQCRIVEVGSFDELDNSHHLLPPPLAWASGDDDIGDAAMRHDGGFDLLGENLLATGIDRHRITAQHLYRPVFEQPCAIARHRVPHAVNDRKGAHRLLRVAEVPKRNVTGLRQPADNAAARLEQRTEVFAHHFGTRPYGECSG